VADPVQVTLRPLSSLKPWAVRRGGVRQSPRGGIQGTGSERVRARRPRPPDCAPRRDDPVRTPEGQSCQAGGAAGGPVHRGDPPVRRSLQAFRHRRQPEAQAPEPGGAGKAFRGAQESRPGHEETGRHRARSEPGPGGLKPGDSREAGTEVRGQRQAPRGGQGHGLPGRARGGSCRSSGQGGLR